MNGPRAGFPPPALAGPGSALPDFALAVVFAAAWIHPASLPDRTVAWCVLVILLEFFVVHSAGFTGFVMTGGQPPQKKLLGMLGLGAFYTLLLGGIAISAGSWWLLASFWALMLNRMLSGLFVRGGDGERMFVMASWAVSVFFYIVFVMLTCILPIPRLGITPAVVGAQGFTIGGLWTSEPHRAVACGAFYFFAMGVSELFMHRWMGGRARVPEPA